MDNKIDIRDYAQKRIGHLEKIKHHHRVFAGIVEDLSEYVVKNKLQALILGISGGIDSTICAIICREVAKRAGIPLIGRSLTIWNKKEEYSTAQRVGEAFCDDFQEVNLGTMFNCVQSEINVNETRQNEALYGKTKSKELNAPITLGNIQARCRMIYLYHLAGANKGIVIDTDNKTENCLGFFTIFGDQGDYKPIGNLWKMEVYELGKWVLDNVCHNDKEREALSLSLGLTPTDGLGISKSDVEQLGASSYDEVDKIFHAFFTMYGETLHGDCKAFIKEFLDKIIENTDEYPFSKNAAKNVLTRWLNSEFKRLPTPVADIYYK